MKLRKVYLNQINEDWVVDRFRKEWYQFNSEISSEKINNSDIVWIIAPWMWKKLSKRQLLNKKLFVQYIISILISLEKRKKKIFIIEISL